MALGSHNLHLAPSPKRVDDLMAVPIDIQELDSHIIFDVSAKSAHAKSTIQFISGVEDGAPIFDLRQDIIRAHLNDEIFSVDKLQHHDFGGGPNAELRILEKTIPSGTENTLTLTYDLNQPNSPRSQPIGWDPPRLYFEFWFSDLWPARYLEMWFPSNLIYDQFKFKLRIEIINTGIKHTIFSNGQINVVDQNHWQIEFPDRFNSFSPMLCIVSSDRVEYRQGVMTLPDNGNQLLLDTFKISDSTSEDLVIVENNLKDFITNNVMNIGPYIHGNRFTTYLWSNTGGRSMEYDGAVTTILEALKHEVFHSWFARGLKPASQNDSWMDEGWTVYNTGQTSPIHPFDMADRPVTLSPANPFNRITPSSNTSPDAYKDGSRFYAGLAAALGYTEVQSYMNSFFRINMHNLVTTGQLEKYLIDKSGNKEIADYFHRFVYGIDR